MTPKYNKFGDIMSDEFIQPLKAVKDIYDIFQLLKDTVQGYNFIKSYKKGKINVEWIEKINNKFKRGFEVYGLLPAVPDVEIQKKYELQHDFIADLEICTQKLNAIGGQNEPHAIVIGDPRKILSTGRVNVATLDYVTVMVLRGRKRKPALLSTCAVLFCEESREMIFQKRSMEVATMKGRFHTIGGAYRPSLDKPEEADTDLFDTNIREVFEESKIKIGKHSLPKMILSREIPTGFIQIVFLGFNLVSNAVDEMKENWEGKLVKVPYDSLEEYLLKPNWVESGKGQVLAWLALGAPGSITPPKFKNKTAVQLFNNIIKQL